MVHSTLFDHPWDHHEQEEQDPRHDQPHLEGPAALGQDPTQTSF
jgi:hypothetical protein